MVNCQADDPGAGIFRPVCETLQKGGRLKFATKNDDARCLELNRRHGKNSLRAFRQTRTKKMQSLTFQPAE